jgi:hypothetical protein
MSAVIDMSLPIKRLLLTGGMIVLALIMIVTALLLIANREQQGTVTSLHQLPKYGDRFPQEAQNLRFRYSYFSVEGTLLATGDVPAGEFPKLCAHFGVDREFDPTGTVQRHFKDVRYLPTNGPVYFLQKGLYPGGRVVADIYLQPAKKDSNAAGRLFVHIAM